MTALGEEQAQLEIREKEMREMIAKAEEKRSWFAAFREWIESVATFLDEKVSIFFVSLNVCIVDRLYALLVVPAIRKA